MSVRRISVVVPAPAATAFEVVHDYAKRLDWDSMLSAARLLDGAISAGRGVRTLCAGTWRSGRMAMVTEYVSFRPAERAAVRMVAPSGLFARFAATIRHRDVGTSSSVVEYVYSFRARPRALAWVLGPILDRMLARETRARLDGLCRYLARTASSRRGEGP